MNTAIKCPHCGSLAVLYCAPHPNAGIWECETCGSSDTHEHDSQVVVAENAAGEAAEIYECGTCGVQLEGNPNDSF